MNVNYSNVKLNNFIVHCVENKESGKPLILSSNETSVNDEQLRGIIIEYFFSSFKSDNYFHFIHNSNIEMNEIYSYTNEVFDNNSSFLENSINIAKHLSDCSIHPKVKNGKVFIAYFNNCIIDDIVTDAIGVFKIENLDYFLKTHESNKQFDINYEQGINIDKIDKGCLIFNLEKENGNIVSIIDKTNKNIEAKYWTENFLHVEQRKDEYYNTQNVLSLCKNFIKEGLPEELDISKADQVDFLNKAVEYFKKNEDFDMSDFKKVVMRKPEVAESFNQYKSEYEFARELAVLDRFSISEAAVKKQARALKSVIKLDKNFHIYVHGDRDMIEQGTDEEGRKYYKIYYSQES